MLATLLAIAWNPTLRGFLVVLIAFLVLCGSVYLLLGTNLGFRLGFLVALAALFGWMAIMGSIWWVYGIGLKGKEPTWQPKEIIYGDLAGSSFEVAQTSGLADATTQERVDGWIRIAEEDPAFGQAVASAEEFIAEAEAFEPGTYEAQAVFDKGGERSPLIFGEEALDFVAFRHAPHYALVEVQPLVPQIEEPGRAAPTEVIDEAAGPTYVLMVRDLGTKRQPAIFITIGSTIVTLWACWRLNKRDELLREHLANPNPVPVPATTGA